MTACSLCGKTRWRTREEAPPYRVVECDCGLVFVTPQPAPGVLAAAYDREYYAAWQGQARQRERLWRRRLATVEALAGASGELLDVGCGGGDFLRLARMRGWNVRGTEISAYAAKAAEANGLSVFQGEVWEAKFPEGSVDVVTCWHALEHSCEPRRIIQEMYRVLRPDGWLALATPNLDNRIFRVAYRLARRRALRLFDPGDRELHLFHFSARTLLSLVASEGFEVVKLGFDRGAAALWGQRVVDAVAYGWFRLTGLNWGLGLELIAKKPAAACHGERGDR